MTELRPVAPPKARSGAVAAAIADQPAQGGVRRKTSSADMDLDGSPRKATPDADKPSKQTRGAKAPA